MRTLLVFLSLSCIYSQDTTYTCNGWAQNEVGDYLLENNIWGQGAITDFSQCIYTTNNSRYGWTWNWPNQGTNVKAYPEVIFGKKPWSQTSTHQSLPQKVSNIETFIVDFDVDISASGSYNLAFEFWVTSDSLSNEEEITTEVMIWTAGDLLQPAGSMIAGVEFNGIGYSLYKSNFDNWVYYAFLSDQEQLNGTLYIHDFIQYMIDNNYLYVNDFIANIEMGNEVVNGVGRTDVNQFFVSVNENLDIKSSTADMNLYKLFNAKPNPFNPLTTINYFIPNKDHVNITIYDLKGRIVKTLINSLQFSGYKTVTWDSKNNLDHLANSGVYLYRIQTGNFVQTKKVILLK